MISTTSSIRVRSRLALCALLAAAVALLCSGGAIAASPADQIVSVAGTGAIGFSGDGGQATSAELDYPVAGAVDAQGNLYFADDDNQRVRKVSPSGVITTVAGTGVAGFSGDGGQATSAELDFPTSVAVDSRGDIYIADAGNDRVRKVSPSGVITTVAGTGAPGFSGDGGPATSAELYYPDAVAVGPHDQLYIADCLNARVRMVATSGTITTVAGDGVLGFSGDGGPATSAELKSPIALATDPGGDLYIVDSTNQRVRMVSAQGTITTIAGNGVAGFSGDGGQATSAELNYPRGAAVDAAGNLYVADRFNNRIRKITPDGRISTIAGTGTVGYSGDGGQASSAQLSGPAGVATGPGGDVYIFDSGNDRVRTIVKESPTASFQSQPTTGSAPLDVAFNAAASSDPDGSLSSYSWNFGDGSTGSGESVGHTYANPGNYTATLTVSDDGGATATANQTITVAPPAAPPVPPPPITTTPVPAPPAPTPSTLAVSVLAPASERVLSSHDIMLVASCSRTCRLVSSGTVTLDGAKLALSVPTMSIPANTQKTIRVYLGRPERTLIRQALALRDTPVARFTLRAIRAGDPRVRLLHIAIVG